MNRARLQDFRQARQQSGAVLLAFTLVIVVGVSFLLIKQLNANSNPNVRAQNSYENLLVAKQALIAYAVAYPEYHLEPDSSNPDIEYIKFGPGYLPCPDRHAETNTNYFGKSGTGNSAGGACSKNGLTSIGRFPGRQKEIGIGVLKDSAGEYFWYVVSDNYRNNPKINESGGVMNSDTPGQIVLDGQNDIVAVIIAPGEPLAGQVRNADNFNNVNHYLEGINADLTDEHYYEFSSGIKWDESGNVIANDIVIPLTRQELMVYIEKRVLSEVKTAIDRYRKNSTPDFIYAYPWLSPFRTPYGVSVLSGDASESAINSLINDSSVDFTTLDLSVGDLIQNITDGTVGQIDNINNTALAITPFPRGSPNMNFDESDTYRLPRFSGLADTHQGQLPIHTDGTVFYTPFTLDWNYTDDNGAIVTVTATDIDDDYTMSLSETIQTSTNTLSELQLAFTEDKAACIWSTHDQAECFASLEDNSFISGVATSNTSVSGNSLILEDSNKDFYRVGVRRGDIIQNLSKESNIPFIISTASATTEPEFLEDNSQNFITSSIVPHYFLVEKENGDKAEVIAVDTERLTLRTLQTSDNNPIQFNDGDAYTITQIIQTTVTSISSANPNQIEAVEISGGPALTFETGDRYRVRIAAAHFQGVADDPTPVWGSSGYDPNNPLYQVWENDADKFERIKVGAVVENSRFNTIGVVVEISDNPSDPWFKHTPLIGHTHWTDILKDESYTIHEKYIDQRDYRVSIKINGHSFVHEPDGSETVLGMKVRDVCVGYDENCLTLSTPESVPSNNGKPIITINDFSLDLPVLSETTLTSPGETSVGRFRLADIRMDMTHGNIVGDDSYDLPDWFIENHWHHLILLAYTEDFEAGSSSACAGSNCIRIKTVIESNDGETTTYTDGIKSLVLIAGEELAEQTREGGSMGDYFDFDNSNQDNLFEKRQLSTGFNDTVLLLE